MQDVLYRLYKDQVFRQMSVNIGSEPYLISERVATLYTTVRGITWTFDYCFYNQWDELASRLTGLSLDLELSRTFQKIVEENWGDGLPDFSKIFAAETDSAILRMLDRYRFTLNTEDASVTMGRSTVSCNRIRNADDLVVHKQIVLDSVKEEYGLDSRRPFPKFRIGE